MINEIIQGSALENLQKLEADSIDLIVTDPPYGYSFMNKDWDKAVVPTDTWRQCLRVLKPGAFAFIMSSPRQDVFCKMILNLIEAGFRTDFSSIYWAYASGFPKAADVSKLVDKRNGRNFDTSLKDYLNEKRKQKGVSFNQINEYLGTALTGGGAASAYMGDKEFNEIPTQDNYNKLKTFLDLDNRFDELIEREEAERNVIGSGGRPPTSTSIFNIGTGAYDYTKPATEQAKQLEGAYAGFQPKPALENILCVQKPLTIEAELTIITSNCLYWIHRIQWQSVESAIKSSSLQTIVEDTFVQKNVIQKVVEEAKANIGKVAGSNVPTDILKSILDELTEKQNMNWSTDLLWKIILVGILSKVNKYTTEMATAQITELKTLNLLLSQSTQNNTTQCQEILQNGFLLNVSIVESILISALTRYNTVDTTVQNSVSDQAEQQQSNVNNVENHLKLDQNSLSENSSTAPPNATSKAEVKIILIVMKPLSEKSYVDQALANKKGITWLDSVRIPYQNEDDKDAGWHRDDYGFGFTKWSERHGYDKVKKELENGEPPNDKGRFPANLLVEDDVLNDGKITGAGITGSGTARRGNMKGSRNVYGKYTRDNDYPDLGYNDTGSFSRYFSLDSWGKTLPFLIVPKPAKAEKGEFNKHPTVKSLKLMSYLITMGSREGDMVLDPFCGSGTVLIAAHELYRQYLGIEISSEYCEIARERLRPHKEQKRLV